MAQCLKTKTLFSQTIKNNFFFQFFYLFLVRIGTQLSPFRKVFSYFWTAPFEWLFPSITTHWLFSPPPYPIAVVEVLTAENLQQQPKNFQQFSHLQPKNLETNCWHNIQYNNSNKKSYSIQYSTNNHRFFYIKIKNKKKKKEKKSHNLTIPKSCKRIKLYLPNPPFDNNTPIKNPNHYHVQASMSSGVAVEPKIFLIWGFRITD